MDTITKKKSILKLLVSAVLVLCWGICFFAFGLRLALLFILCFFLFFVFSVLLYTVWFLPFASEFVILYPELQLAICACLIHSIGEEREKQGVEMGRALFLSSRQYCFPCFPQENSVQTVVIGSTNTLGRDMLEQVILYASVVQES